MVDLATIQTIATVITALAATGVLGLAWTLYRKVEVHERVLFGDDYDGASGGIVPRALTAADVAEEEHPETWREVRRGE